jgi:hypothetical protein
MPTPRYLPLDQVDACTFYGVKVCSLGEDGDGEAAFTHNPRRAIAATAALYRKEYGVRARRVQIIGEPQWWRIVDNCGCGTTCACPLNADGDPVHGCEHFGLPPCVPEGFVWTSRGCAADDPGALPVLTLEVSEHPPPSPTGTAAGGGSAGQTHTEQTSGPLVRHWPDPAPAAAKTSKDRVSQSNNAATLSSTT